MYKLMLSLTAALILAACASHPGTGTPAAGQKETLSQALQQAGGTAGVQNGPNGQKLICSSNPQIGSHLAHVQCLTPAQEAAREKANQKAMQEMQQQAALCHNPPACMKA